MMAVRHAFLNEPQGPLSGQCTDEKLLRLSANSMGSSPQFINREHTKRCICQIKSEILQIKRFIPYSGRHREKSALVNQLRYKAVEQKTLSAP